MRRRPGYGGGLVAAAILLLASTAATAASLQQTTVVHGTACSTFEISGPQEAYTSDGILSVAVGAISLTAICPVSLNFQPSSTGSVASLGTNGSSCTADTASRPWVEVVDHSTYADVSCTLFVLGPSGAAFSSFTVTTTGSSTAVQRLFFNAGGTVLPEGRHLVVTCDLPPKASASLSPSWLAAIGVPTCQVTP